MKMLIWLPQVTGSSIAPRPVAAVLDGSSRLEVGGGAQVVLANRSNQDITDDQPLAVAASGDARPESVSVHGQLLLLPASCPEEYGSLVRDCLQLEPAGRPVAAEVLQRLQRMAASELMCS